MGERIHNSIKPINGYDNHNEAGEIKTNYSDEDHNPASDVISSPGHCVGPSHFKRNLEKNYL